MNAKPSNLLRRDEPQPLAPLLVDKHDAARLLCVSTKTLQRRTADGTIPHVPLGGRVLYSVETLRDFIRKQERAQPPA